MLYDNSVFEVLIKLASAMPEPELPSESEPKVEPEAPLSNTEVEDEHEDIETLDSLQQSLKKSRWNVFMFLGLAFLMFGFALFPMPMDADFEYGTAEKDLGFVWGPSLGGEDFMDVPYEVSVKVDALPATTGNITLQVYVLQIDDCDDPEAASSAETKAQAGGSHEYQYGYIDSPVEGKTYKFDFDLDMGQYCLNAKAVGPDGTIVDPSRTNLEVTGKLWPNQVIAGIPGIVFLGLSTFAFVGAQKVGKKVKAILESEKVTKEQMVLAEARQQRIVAGPGGPPKSVQGPGGPPKVVTGPSGAPPSQTTAGPVNVAQSSGETTRTGPPPAGQAEEPSSAEASDGSTFEDAGNGYYYRKLANGSYEQQIYVKDNSGQYVVYQAE
tara:strand:- start:337 stop:1482 length:1146 start_codon:yes stop_codon:yes gene_type:complete